MARPRKAAEDKTEEKAPEETEEAETESLEHDDEPDSDATYAKRLSELEDRIAAMEVALGSQLGLVY